MSEPILTEEGRITLDKVVNIWPPIIHMRKREIL